VSPKLTKSGFSCRAGSGWEVQHGTIQSVGDDIEITALTLHEPSQEKKFETEFAERLCLVGFGNSRVLVCACHHVKSNFTSPNRIYGSSHWHGLDL